MTPSVLQFARRLMKKRKFSRAISLLETNEKNYKGSYEFYLALGTSCLYVGDYGNAWNYYEEARRIKVQGTELYLGQAVILLRRGETDRAVDYYLDVQKLNPQNEVSAAALEFIRKSNNNYDVISSYFDSGKIERFYPPLGMNPDWIRNGILGGLLLGFCISVGIVIGYLRTKPKVVKPLSPKAQFIKDMSLSEQEKLSPSQLAGGAEQGMAEATQPPVRTAPAIQSAAEAPYRELTDAEIVSSYEKAVKLVTEEHDNAAHVEINKVLGSNAKDSIKAKARDLLSTLRTQTFDSLKDNYSYTQIAKNPALYEDCYVIWDGRISNMLVAEDGSMSSTMLVGYDDLEKGVVEGFVPVLFSQNPQPPLTSEKPIRILGRVGLVNGTVVVYRVAHFQPVTSEKLPELKLAK